MPSARDMKLMAVMTALFLALAGGILFGGLPADTILVGPLLVIAIPLLGGRYIGEERIARLRRARTARPRRAAPVLDAPSPLRAPLRVLCAGLLLARVHASRPPPAGPLTA